MALVDWSVVTRYALQAHEQHLDQLESALLSGGLA
jgi:hypothetical protein